MQPKKYSVFYTYLIIESKAKYLTFVVAKFDIWEYSEY